MVLSWEKTTSKLIGDFRIFTLRQDTRISPRTGQAHNFFVIDSRDWINVIPLTPEGKVVFIHQFRHGTAEVSLEIPGGIVDAEDPSVAETARRELLEETGYEVEQIIHIGTIDPNPAFLNNHCYTFLALGAHKTQEVQFDSAEDIAVEEIDLSEVEGMINNGRIRHSLVVAAFYHLERYFRQNPTLKPANL